MASEPATELRHPSWEVLVFLLAILSLADIVLLVLPIDRDAKNVVLIVDSVLCIVFMADFLYAFARERATGAMCLVILLVFLVLEFASIAELDVT
jgi:hypothetical protein